MIDFVFAAVLAAVDFKPTEDQKRHLMERVEHLLVDKGYHVEGYAKGQVPDFSKAPAFAGPLACWDQVYAFELAQDALTKAGAAQSDVDIVSQQIASEVAAETEDPNCVGESAD